jgi:hypothetical protein
MSTFFICNIGNSKELKAKHVNGFFFVLNEFNRDSIRLYNDYVVYKAWAKILFSKKLLYLHTETFVENLFKKLSDQYVQDMNYIMFNLTVTKNFILNKKLIPTISFSQLVPAFTKPYYMSYILKNKSCVTHITQLIHLPIKLMELAPKMQSKFLFLLIDPISTMLLIIKNPKMEYLMIKNKNEYSTETVLYHIICYLLALLNYNLVSLVKVFLAHNSVNLNYLGRRVNANPTIKREAIVIKINALYVEINKISSIQSDKQKAILTLLDEALESFVEGEIRMNQFE